MNSLDPKTIDNIIEHLCKYNNVTKTAEEFNCDPMELYSIIPVWDGCCDRLYDLEDYKIYRYKLGGRQEELEEFQHICVYDYETQMRTPEKEELDLLITEYHTNKHTLYELADEYNLVIINLFRLLKEHKLIEKESDAIGYDEFYKEYIGEYEFTYNNNDIKKNLGLIQLFYNYIENN
jgi:hypothetical protein